jgi:hypothetical protein
VNIVSAPGSIRIIIDAPCRRPEIRKSIPGRDIRTYFNCIGGERVEVQMISPPGTFASRFDMLYYWTVNAVPFEGGHQRKIGCPMSKISGFCWIIFTSTVFEHPLLRSELISHSKTGLACHLEEIYYRLGEDRTLTKGSSQRIGL